MKRVGFTPIFILLFVYSCLADEPKRRRHEIATGIGFSNFWEKVEVTNLEKFEQLNPGYDPKQFEKWAKEPALCLRTYVKYKYRFKENFFLGVDLEIGRIGTIGMVQAIKVPIPIAPNTNIAGNFYNLFVKTRSIPLSSISFPISIGWRCYFTKNFGLNVSLKSYAYLIYKWEDHSEINKVRVSATLDIMDDPNVFYFTNSKVNHYTEIFDRPYSRTTISTQKKSVKNWELNALADYRSIVSIPLEVIWDLTNISLAAQAEFGGSVLKKEIYSTEYPSETRLNFLNISLSIGYKW